MDELEISGKRFISTKRAAKEHKYHADYIGQLIRGNKVEGQKVGRAWYVNADSLEVYFSKEKGGEVSKKKEEKIEPIVKEKEDEIVEETEKQEDPTRSPVAAAKEVEMEEEAPHHVVVRVGDELPEEKVSVAATEIKKASRFQAKEKPSLVYLSDDEPTLPRLSKREVTNKHVSSEVMPAAVETAREQEFEVRSRGSVARTIALAGIGVVIFVAVAGTSVALNAKLVVEEGKPASIGFSFK